MDRASMVPKTAKGRPTAVRAGDYTLRLPVSPRRLGGQLSVSEATFQLQRFFGVHRGLMRAIAGRLMGIAEMELKIELPYHLYLHAEACRALRERLCELRGGSPEQSHELSEVAPLFDEVLAAPSTPDLVLAVHGIVGKSLLDAERDYMRRTDGLCDQPSVRVLSRIVQDLAPVLEYGQIVVGAFEQVGYRREDHRSWLGRVEAHLAAIGGVAGDAPRGQAPPPAPAFERPTACARDPRMSTFHEPRSARQDDGLGARCEDDHQRARLSLLRTQRDELDAVETFANVLFDMPEAPFDFQMDLARLIWDEARHAEIGHQAIARLGLDPFEVPCSVMGINVRAPLPPDVAFAQISTFGELPMVGPMARFVEQAYANGDREHAMVMDFIHSDEVLHVRHGRAWMRGALSGGDLRGLEERARRAVIDRLVEEGVCTEAQVATLCATELGLLVGE